MIRRKRPPMRQAVPAGELLEKLLHSFGLDKRLQQYSALVIWDEVVGAQIAAHARPHKLRGAVLEVCVDQPAWMQQLQLMKPQLLQKLNDHPAKPGIKEIFLKKGKLPQQVEKAPEPPPVWKTSPLDPEIKKQIAEILNAVEDEELRYRLEQMLSKQVRLTMFRENAREKDDYGEETI